MKKIVFLAGSQSAIDQFWNEEIVGKAKEAGFMLTVQCHEGMTLEDVKPDPDAVALITTWGSPRCGLAILEKMPCVRIIGHAAGSVKLVIDPVVYDRRIRVVSANFIMSKAVAEWSLMMTLLVSRNFFAASSYPGRHRMDWKNSFRMEDIKNQTIGCWGFGDTTRHLLRMLAPLAPKRILVHSNHASEEEIHSFGARKVPFEQLLSESDIMHCLVGVNQENLHRIGARELALLKNGAAIINAGRAGLIQEQPLIDALASKRISAVLDVYYTEPLPVNSILYSFDNLIMTPHNAGFPGRELFVPFLLEEFKRFFAGEKLQGEVDQHRFESMTDECLAKKRR